MDEGEDRARDDVLQAPDDDAGRLGRSNTLRDVKSKGVPAFAEQFSKKLLGSSTLERNPDLRFTGRRLYARDGLVVSEWTATATDRDGRRVEWDGIDVFPFENGLILRKDVYSSSHAPRVLE